MAVIGRYVAYDAAGNVYNIVAYGRMVDLTIASDPTKVLAVKPDRLATDTGDNLSYLGKGEYQLLNGTVLKSTDPNAP